MANKTLTLEELLSKAEKSLDNSFLFKDFLKGIATDDGKKFYFATDDRHDLNEKLSKVEELQNKIERINIKFKDKNIKLTEDQENVFNAFINVKLKELAIEKGRLEQGIEESNIRDEASDSFTLYQNYDEDEDEDEKSEFSDYNAQNFKPENDEGIESIINQKLSDEDIKLSIDLLVSNVEKHPQVFYEIFINPSFIYDEDSARNMGAVDGDINGIRKFLEYNENAKFLFSFDKANNNEGMPVKMTFGEFNELADIFAKHLPLNIKNRKEKFYDFKNIDNELNNKLESFANKHPGYFNLLQNLFNLSSKNPENDFFLEAEKYLNKSQKIARKSGALIFSENNGKFINAKKIESYKKEMSNEPLSDWLSNLDIETMQYINEPLYVQIKNNYGDIVKNPEGAKNKLLCVIDLKAALKQDSLLEGAKTLADLKRQKNNFQYEDQKDFLNALINVAESELTLKFLKKEGRETEVKNLNPRKKVALLAEVELLPEMEKNDSLNELLRFLNEQLNEIETKHKSAADSHQKTLKDVKDFYSYLNKEQQERLKQEAKTDIKNNKEEQGYKYTAEMESVDEVDFARALMKELYPNQYRKYEEDRNKVLNIGDENLQYRKQIDLLQAKIKILEGKIKNVKDTNSRLRPL